MSTQGARASGTVMSTLLNQNNSVLARPGLIPHFSVCINSEADDCKNRSNYDTSNRFGTNTLWGSLFKKKRKISKWPPFSNMAATGYPEILWGALKLQQMVKKDYCNSRVYVLFMQNVQLMLWILFKCSDYFNMVANLQDGRHRLSRNISFALDGSRQPKIWFEE